MADVIASDLTGREMVSILMPSYNYACYLPAAIESILRQTYRNLELVIVDDCSTDGSLSVAEEWLQRDSRIVLVRHERNQGLAATRNSGLAASRGEFIALCDTDDIWLPFKLEKQLDCLRTDSRFGMVHSDAWIIDKAGAKTGKRFSELYHRRGQPVRGELFDELCRRNFICVPTVVARREALEFAGGFDASLRSLEDWVCWTRLSAAFQVGYLNEPLALYRYHAGSLSNTKRNMAQNRLRALEILESTIAGISSGNRYVMRYSRGVSQWETGDYGGAARTFAALAKQRPWDCRSLIRWLASSACAMGERRRSTS